MLANEAAQDAIAQNLANAGTTGYKRDLPQFQSFPETLLRRVTGAAGPSVGGLGPGAGLSALATDFSGGALQQTGNPLDVALTGDAYLAVQTPQGVRYSRDGALTRDAQGLLVQANGQGAVLDQSGRPISLPARAKDITISPRGDVRADGVSVGQLQLVSVTRTTGASKQGDNLFAQASAAPAGPDATVHQGYLEASNVNVVQEMVAMIAVQRAYETDQKMVQAEDDATNKAVNDVPKV
ncbi:MAG: flagellar basal-body rod protein FlgF [Armatimonadetes bacterium]|nr:flagellar basal-body rod protein FlgF [Armatimonadota bacterium]